MKKSAAYDIKKLKSIYKWITYIKTCFENQRVATVRDFENNVFIQAACTQFITNLYEDRKKLRDETVLALVLFNKLKLGAARHVASHDYESVNFHVIYDVCRKLTTPALISEILQTIKSLETAPIEMPQGAKRDD